MGFRVWVFGVWPSATAQAKQGDLFRRTSSAAPPEP